MQFKGSFNFSMTNNDLKQWFTYCDINFQEIKSNRKASVWSGQENQ